MVFCIGCKDRLIDPVDPWQYGGILEVRYRQIFQVINPDVDLTKSAVNFYNNQYGGGSSSYFDAIGEKTWMATLNLSCSLQPYWLYVADYQVSNNEAVGEELSIRRKGDAEWIVLTCIVPAPNRPGKAAKMVFNNGSIQIPPCN